MPLGLGWVVARWCMVRALGQVHGNVMGSIVVSVVERKALAIGPKLLWGSNGFVITCFSLMYLAFSTSCKCLSAAAFKRCCTSAVKSKSGGSMLWVMVMSAPIVV